MTHTIEASTITKMGAMTSIHFVKPIYDITVRGVLDTSTLKGGMYEK